MLLSPANLLKLYSISANKRIVWDCQPRRFALRLPDPHAYR